MNTDASTSARSGRGRIDKRHAILDAAFTVFAREGYANAGVDTIAAEAGVAKPTIYNHFGDKETLFREAVLVDADRVLAKNLAAVDLLRDSDGDVRDLLETVGYELVGCYLDPRSWAIRRIIYAEIIRFPNLMSDVRNRVAVHVDEALADRIARLSLAGRLKNVDPARAAEQFTALLISPMETRSALGTRDIPEAERREVVADAVDTFLHAFSPTE